MLKFIDGADATVNIKGRVASSRKVRFAVAFWGAGATEDLGLAERARKLPNDSSTQIVCNLRSGGTYPQEIRKLLDHGINVLQCDTLHGKVYMFDDCFVLGSSNASSNGLALQGAEISGWHEANIFSDDRDAWMSASAWFDGLPKRAITKRDLEMADLAFQKHRRALPGAWAKGANLLQALNDRPQAFIGKNIFITFWENDLREDQNQSIEKEGQLEENRGLDVSGVGYELKPSSTYVGFWCLEGGRKFEYDSFFRTRDYTWNSKDVWFCEPVENVLGIRTIGAQRSWSHALAAAHNDIASGRRKDAPIEICDFYDRYVQPA